MIIDLATLPLYECHKRVRALKIAEIRGDFHSPVLEFEDENYSPIPVTTDYCYKHKPEAGGYFVVYDGGYESYSPASAFEAGYSKI